MPGNTLKLKLEQLGTETGPQLFKRLIEAGNGFCTQHDDPGSIVVIPASFIFAIWRDAKVDDSVCSGIRWGFMSSTLGEVELVKTIAKQACVAYPSMDAVYKPFIQQLDQYVLPGLAS